MSWVEALHRYMVGPRPRPPEPYTADDLVRDVRTVQHARLEVIDLRPDDVLVLRVPGPLDESTATQLHALLRDKFPNRRCLVLGDNMVLDVLRETKGEGSL